MPLRDRAWEAGDEAQELYGFRRRPLRFLIDKLTAEERAQHEPIVCRDAETHLEFTRVVVGDSQAVVRRQAERGVAASSVEDDAHGDLACVDGGRYERGRPMIGRTDAANLRVNGK
jgi:hypothetical protein